MPPHLLHVFSNFVPSGPEIRTVELIAAFGAEFRHSILSMDGRTGAAKRLPPGAPVRLLDAPPRAGSLKTARHLRELFRREAPDLVLTYNWGAIDAVIAAVTLGLRRVVHHEEGFNADEAASFKGRRVLTRRFLLPRAHRVVVPSRHLEKIATDLWRLPAALVRLIPNGIRLDAYRPADGNPELREALGIPADAPLAGSCGHLRPVKNYLRLLDAVAAVDPRYRLHVLLVGEGEERAALEARAACPDLAGRVRLAGYQADPAPFYRAMDLFALTSDSEQMPVSLLEAMASCLPVVATDVGDVRAMLPPEQADFLVPLAPPEIHGTVARLTHHLEQLVADGAMRLRLGLANRRRVAESYTFETMCTSYHDLYEEALRAA